MRLNLPDAQQQPWRQFAACKTMDVRLFYPERGGSVKEAKAACAVCPARRACLEYAMDNDEKFGIHGGTSERQRRVLRKGWKAARRAREVAA